jgi:hypothetical protein
MARPPQGARVAPNGASHLELRSTTAKYGARPNALTLNSLLIHAAEPDAPAAPHAHRPCALYAHLSCLDGGRSDP